MADLPQGVTDPLDPAFQTDDLWTDSAQNAEKIGNVFVPLGPLPDTQSHDEPTAEAENAKRAFARHIADYFQGLAPATALELAEWLRLPRYATGALPAGSAGNEARVYFDTTTNRIVYDNGGALVSVATTTDVAGAGFSMRVQAEGGSIDVLDPELLEFDEDDFAIAGDSSGLTIALGEVGLNHLPTSAAQAVLGRSAGTTGVRADIAGTGTTEAPTILTSAGTVAFRSISQLGAGISTILDQDLSALGTNAFTDGTEAVGTLGNVTVVNTASAGANWGLVNGTGLRMSGASGVFSSSTQTGAYFYTTISALAALGYVPGRILYIDLVVTAGSFTNGNDRMVFGLWGPAASPASTSASRLRAGFRGNSGGTQTYGTVADTSVTSFSDSTSPLAVSVRIDPCSAALTTGVGTYSGGWPSFDYTTGNNGPQTAGVNQHASLSTRLVFAVNWINTCAWDISRWRFRQG